MASSTYGRKLNPYRRLRDPLGVKGVRQSVVVTNNPSSIDQNQQLLVRFPNLGAHDVVVPGTARLAFTVSLTSTDANRTIVKNVGRAVVKKTTIKISGNEVLSIDDSDVLHCYQDLWKTAQERRNSQYQGIDLSDDSNVTRIRVGAGNKDETETEDAAIAAAYGNRYHIPLDFELLESHMPFYQSALGDRLEYELTFIEYSRVVVATGDAAASYSIDNIALEFDMVTQPDLARQIRNQYAGRLAVLYERVLRHRKITANKSDTLWNINLNVPARSMSGILMLFEEPAAAFQRDTEAFCNPSTIRTLYQSHDISDSEHCRCTFVKWYGRSTGECIYSIIIYSKKTTPNPTQNDTTTTCSSEAILSTEWNGNFPTRAINGEALTKSSFSHCQFKDLSFC